MSVPDAGGDESDGPDPAERADRAWRVGLTAAVVVLALAVAALIAPPTRSVLIPATTVTSTVTTTATRGPGRTGAAVPATLPTSYVPVVVPFDWNAGFWAPELPSDVQVTVTCDAGASMGDAATGTLTVPAEWSANCVSSASGRTQAVLNGVVRVELGNLHQPATDTAVLGDAVSAWLTARFAGGDAISGEGVMEMAGITSATSLCVDAQGPWTDRATTIYGHGCVFPTPGGSTYLWIWVPDPTLLDVYDSLLAAYTPGD